MDARNILKHFGLDASPRILINLVGDVTKQKKLKIETAFEEEGLVTFMQKVVGRF